MLERGPSRDRRGIGGGSNAAGPWTAGVSATHLLFLIHLVTFLTLVVGENSAWYAQALGVLGVSGAAALLEQPWTLLTYVLVHRHPLEFVIGSGLLLLAGTAVEQRLGSRRYLLFYALSAALVALAHVAVYEAGMVQGRLFTGSVGVSGGLLTAYLFTHGTRRRIGSVPFPAFYVMVAAGMFALLATIGIDTQRTLRDRLVSARQEAFTGEALTATERVDMLHTVGVLELQEPDQLSHMLGLVLGACSLLMCQSMARARQRYHVLREINTLQEEVDARAQVEFLLEKISREGFQALTRQERKFLHYASRFYRAGVGPTGSPH
jgi:membrane associated rhomboid family serine protease